MGLHGLLRDLMTRPLPDLTLFIGPQSRHGLSVNLAVRDNRPAMISAGLASYPTRMASPALRALADPNGTLDDRRAAFAALTDEKPAFYSALNFLGAPHRGFRLSDLFPEAESQLGGLAEAAGDAAFRLVMAPDTLPDLFLAAGSDALEARVRETPWEQFYEVNWADLVIETQAALPGAEIIVLTHSGTALGGEALSEFLFGPAADAVDARVFLRGSLNVTGQAVLDRMGKGVPPDEVARDLYRSFADRADKATCRERLGMDRLTWTLLLQRFDEDVERIAALDGVEVI